MCLLFHHLHCGYAGGMIYVNDLVVSRFNEIRSVSFLFSVFAVLSLYFRNDDGSMEYRMQFFTFCTMSIRCKSVVAN